VPRRSPKLPVYAVSGGFNLAAPLFALKRGDFPKFPFRLPDIKPEFKIFPADWSRIESGYERQLTHTMRAQLLDATRRFLYLEAFERRSEPLAKTKKAIEAWKKAAADLRNALTVAPEGSDASRYAIFLLEEEFRANKRDGIDALISEVVWLEICCALVQRRLEAQKPHQSEWVRWIQRLAGIMNDNAWSVSVRKDAGNKSRSDIQSPFVIFVGELQRCLPSECKRPTHSDSALADAIGKVVHVGAQKASRDA
jgi:hypothetical protein